MAVAVIPSDRRSPVMAAAAKASPVVVHHDGSVGLDWSLYATRVLVLLLFVASILKLSAQSYSPFLYFQF